MSARYTIEVPIHSWPVDKLAMIHAGGDIGIAVFGGFPDSPFNGGRPNFVIDGLQIWNRMFYGLNREQLESARAKFYAAVDRINAQGMSFRFAFTNMFIQEEELTQDNLYPVVWLIAAGQKHGVKNGVIINNTLLEARLRQQFGDKLVYISSCTKYVSPDRVLTPRETMAMYQADSGKYDYIVLTPQDSRRPQLMASVVRENKSGVIVLANTYCSFDCNSYDHYACFSRGNKIPLCDLTSWRVVVESIKFMAPHAAKCSAFKYMFRPLDVEGAVAMQLKAGIVNFKLGRGLGVESLDKIVALIRRT